MIQLGNYWPRPLKIYNEPCKLYRIKPCGIFYWSEKGENQSWAIQLKMNVSFYKRSLTEHSGSLDRALDWGSEGCWFESHRLWGHYVVSWSETLYPLLSTGITQEDPSMF